MHADTGDGSAGGKHSAVRGAQGRRAVPDAAAMRRWLLAEALRPDGAVLSWANPAHPGYPYPEAAGLLLSSLSARPAESVDGAAAADRVAAFLCRSIDAAGGIGRGGIAYLFDSSVALAGLLRYRAAGSRAWLDATVHRLHAFIGDLVAGGAAVTPPVAAADGRWSTEFGAHLVKCVQALHLYSQAFGTPPPRELVAALIDRCGRQPSPVYVHPFCYEQEGHLLMTHYGLGDLFEPIDGALEWLAALQQPNGAILAFANGMDGFGEPRSDATAQAVRLWLCGNRERFGQSIARGLAFLAACQTPAGGIRYAPDRDDLCSWSTMFTVQAVEWVDRPPALDDFL